jgi:hypothetical protein
MTNADLSEGAANTAIVRSKETAIARELVKSDLLKKWGVTRLLDFGCGRAIDAEYYERKGISASGYDRAPKFRRNARPVAPFDFVTMIYVVNVLPTWQERVAAIRDATSFLGSTGRLLVVSRTKAEIDGEARRGGWQKVEDGYVSSQSKGTFQRGHTTTEMDQLLEEAGLTPVEEPRLRLLRAVWTLGVRSRSLTRG